MCPNSFATLFEKLKASGKTYFVKNGIERFTRDPKTLNMEPPLNL